MNDHACLSSPRPFDTQALLSRCMGEASFAMQLVDQFPHAAQQWLEEIGRHWAAGDLGCLAEAVHACKGTAGVLAATGVHALAAEIESAVRAGTVGHLGDLVDKLQREVQRCIASVPEVRRQFLGVVC